MATNRSSSPDVPSALAQYMDLARHIHVMKDYCATEGVAIDAAVAEHIGGFERSRLNIAAMSNKWGPSESSARDDAASFRLLPTPEVVAAIPGALSVAYAAHSALLTLVAPATPESIEWTTAPKSHRRGKERVVFVWSMVATAVAALVAFVLLLYSNATEVARSDQLAGVTTLLRTFEASQPVRSRVLGEGGAELSAAITTSADAVRHEFQDFSNRWASDEAVASLTKRTNSLLQGIALHSAPPLDKSTASPFKDLALALEEVGDLWEALGIARSHGGEHNRAPDFILLVSAGALGAMFYNLYCAHKYIVNRTFDRAQINRYIIRFFMGMVAGMILGHFGGELIKSTTTPGQTPSLSLSRAFMAFMGGYAVEVVDLILMRVVAAVGALFQGGVKKEEKV